jgi:hypothetical protein
MFIDNCECFFVENINSLLEIFKENEENNILFIYSINYI